MQATSPLGFIASFYNPEREHARTVQILLTIGMGAMLALSASGQTNAAPTVTHSAAVVSNSASAEAIRTECINSRRHICGRVLQVTPQGLVVDSGYTSLLRPELSHSWVIRSNVAADRPANLIEENTPGAVCVGLVFVTDIPKRPVPKPYDYVVLLGYPAGQYSYTAVGSVHKTVRRFSVILANAVELNLKAEDRTSSIKEK